MTLKLKKLNDDQRGIMELIFLAVGLLIIFVIWQILPLVNSSISSAVVIPGCTDRVNFTGCSAGHEWNSSLYPDLVNSSEMFTSVGGIYKVTLIVAIIAVLLMYLFSVIPRQGTGGGGSGGNM